MKNKRNAFTLAETVVACTILATALAVSVQMLVAASAQHKAMERSRVALLEAGNVLERLSVQPWSKLNADGLSEWKLSPEADGVLPGGKLEIQVEPATGDPAGKRIAVTVFYNPKKNQPARAVRLVTWRYAVAIAAPTAEVKDETK